MLLDRQRLVSVLDTLKVSVGNKVMDVSFYVKFVVNRKSQSVYLNTTDFHSFIVIDFGDVSLTSLEDVPEVFLIKFQDLHGLIKYSTTQDVMFQLIKNGEHDFIRITTDGEFDFALYQNISLFPTADFECESTISWDANILSDTWDKVSNVVSKDVTKLSYQGVNFDGNWAASDNRRFAIVEDDTIEYDGDSMLIPIIFGDIIARCQGEVIIGKNTTGNMLVIVNDETGMIASMRLLDAKFVDYMKLLQNRQPFIKVVLPKQFLLGILNRLSCFTDKMFKIGSFSIIKNENGASLKCEIKHSNNSGVEILEATDYDFHDLPDLSDGPIATFDYQIDNLASGINSVDSDDEVCIHFQKDGKLWIDDGGFHYLLSRIA